MLEINPRGTKPSLIESQFGTGQDFNILKCVWADWFSRMEIQNATSSDLFIRRSTAISDEIAQIDDIFK